MLQSKCKHSRALPVECCTLCNESLPARLSDLSIDSVVTNLDSVCGCASNAEELRLKHGVRLPVEICERLLNAILLKNSTAFPRYVHIFTNLKATRLKRVKIRNTAIDDEGLRVFLQHKLIELEIGKG